MGGTDITELVAQERGAELDQMLDAAFADDPDAAWIDVARAEEEAKARARDYAGYVAEVVADKKTLSVTSLPKKPKPESEVPSPVAIDLVACALRIGGAADHMPTGFDALDYNTRGGPRSGKRVVIGGAPGAGKTTWTAQNLWNYSLAGHAVLYLAYDEEYEDVMIRLGQGVGIDRDALERGDADAREVLATAFADNHNFHLINGDDTETTVDAASALLVKLRKPGQLSVLGVDSIQTARAWGDLDDKGRAIPPRERIDLVCKAIKRAGRVDGHLVLATSELNRGAYRSSNPSERPDDLAAFKESGGVEYSASMALVLRAVKDQPGLVDVAVPKNRMGSGRMKPFRLQLDFGTAKFREVEMPNPDDESADMDDSPLQKIKEKIVALVEKRVLRPIGTVAELGRKIGTNKTTTSAAVKELLAEGRIEKVGTKMDQKYVIPKH